MHLSVSSLTIYDVKSICSHSVVIITFLSLFISTSHKQRMEGKTSYRNVKFWIRFVLLYFQVKLKKKVFILTGTRQSRCLPARTVENKVKIVFKRTVKVGHTQYANHGEFHRYK